MKKYSLKQKYDINSAAQNLPSYLPEDNPALDPTFKCCYEDLALRISTQVSTELFHAQNPLICAEKALFKTNTAPPEKLQYFYATSSQGTTTVNCINFQ